MKQQIITLSGTVLVEDIIAALEPKLSEEALTQLNDALGSQLSERITFDDCELVADDAIDAIDEAGLLPVGEGLADVLDQGDVQGLAEAIRCGDHAQAEQLLDSLFASLPDAPTLREWIDRGRYSMKARKVKDAGKPTLRDAA